MNEVKTYKIIDDINKLSVAKWEDCLCDQKLSVLVIEGSPSDIDLIEAWSNLYSQYLDILGDAETVYILTLEKDIELLDFKIKTTDGILSVLEWFHVSQLVETLKFFGFDVKNITPGNPHYEHSLRKIQGRLSHLKLKLEVKQKELSQISADEKNETVTRERLRTQRTRLSKFQGYPIKPAKTMVPDYVAILKDYLQQFKTKDDGDK